MQQKPRFHNFHYFNNWLLSAKLLSLLIFLYGSLFSVSCAHHFERQVLTTPNPPPIAESAININTASAEDLERLPRIGSESARKIVEHRAKYGAFRRPENLILVEGMSDKKFREIRSFVKIE
jgi:competence ComEA-like helix-hairpin-helix protein